MKKMMPWLITILLCITLIAIVFIVLARSILGGDSPGEAGQKPVEIKVLSAKQRVEVTSELKEYRRNLKDPQFVAIVSFAFQLDHKKTKESFDEILDIEIKPIVSRSLADLTAEDLNGSQGEDLLESKLLNLINPVLPRGKLIKVEITEIIVTKI